MTLWIGLGLVWLGITLRWWALRELIEHGVTEDSIWEPTRQENYVLTGPYRWMRHPAYVGSLVAISGFGISALGWGGAILSVPSWPFFAYRIHQENKLHRLGK